VLYTVSLTGGLIPQTPCVASLRRCFDSATTGHLTASYPAATGVMPGCDRESHRVIPASASGNPRYPGGKRRCRGGRPRRGPGNCRCRTSADN